MKRRTLSLVLLALAGGAIALTLALQAERKVDVSEFTWSVDRSTAPYSFDLQNKTDESLKVIVTIVAETMTQGDDGVKFLPLGRQLDEIHLAARERRSVKGAVPLIRLGTSETILTLSAELRKAEAER